MHGAKASLVSPYPRVEDLFSSPPFHFARTAGRHDVNSLHSSEVPLLEGMGERRRSEFCAGRHCAHAALAGLGYADFAVLKDQEGAPRWPNAVVGSISHSADVAVAVVARADQVVSVGLDIQDRRPSFPSAVLRTLLHGPEIKAYLNTPPALADLYAYGLFSAKESVYKCIYTATGLPLDFADVSVSMDIRGGYFHAQLIRADVVESSELGAALIGKVGFDESRIYTTVCLLSHDRTYANWSRHP